MASLVTDQKVEPVVDFKDQFHQHPLYDQRYISQKNNM